MHKFSTIYKAAMQKTADGLNEQQKLMAAGLGGAAGQFVGNAYAQQWKAKADQGATVRPPSQQLEEPIPKQDTQAGGAVQQVPVPSAEAKEEQIPMPTQQNVAPVMNVQQQQIPNLYNNIVPKQQQQ